MLATTNSAEVIKLLRQRAALAAFGSFAFRETDLGKILNEAARICAESLEVGFCTIRRYRPEEDDLRVEAGYGWNNDVIGVISQANAGSPPGRAFITGEPVIIPGLRASTGLGLAGFYAEHAIISTVHVLIPGFEARPYGVLEIDSTDRCDYDEHDIKFLTGFANVLAEALAAAHTNRELREALALKNLLAAELHHRIRNQFATIQSMLRIYGAEAPDHGVAMEGVGRLVGVFATVYDHLLGAGLSERVNLSSYAQSLCGKLCLDGRSEGRIGMRYALKPLLMPTDAAITVGMVISELVSNAYAHAFPTGSGTVTLSLAADLAQDEATMTIADDGIGFVEDPMSPRHGIRLARQLVASIGGVCEMVSQEGAGTTWTVRFPNPRSAPLAA